MCANYTNHPEKVWIDSWGCKQENIISWSLNLTLNYVHFFLQEEENILQWLQKKTSCFFLTSMQIECTHFSSQILKSITYFNLVLFTSVDVQHNNLAQQYAKCICMERVADCVSLLRSVFWDIFNNRMQVSYSNFIWMINDVKFYLNN